MLTLPPFELHRPTSLAEVVDLLARHGPDARLLAGGTDLLPNMKHRLLTPGHLIALGQVEGLGRVRVEEDTLCLGAMVPLAVVAGHELVQRNFPALAKAAGQVAGPQLREMGTLGGNLCLDTRCVYVNQTHFWRKALGYCLKKDGTVCHVVKAGKNCVAASSNDTAPVLVALEARIRLVDAKGTSEVSAEGFFRADGIRHTVLEAGQVVAEIRLALPARPLAMGFQKLRTRGAIDYPALNVAVAFAKDPKADGQSVRLVVSALGSRPQLVKHAQGLRGPVDEQLIEAAAEAAYKQCHPLRNINVDPAWRRQMVRVLARRAFREALGTIPE